MDEWRECFMIAFAFFKAPVGHFFSPSLTTSCKVWQAHLICSRSVVGSSLLSAWSSSSSWSVSSTSPKSMDGSEKALTTLAPLSVTIAVTLSPIPYLLTTSSYLDPMASAKIKLPDSNYTNAHRFLMACNGERTVSITQEPQIGGSEINITSFNVYY